MNYLDLLTQASPSGDLALFSLATTGISRNDKIIAIFLGKLGGPIVSMANSDITHEELESTQKYHRIPRLMFENMIKVNPQVMYDSLCNFVTSDLMVTYNTKFATDMIRNLHPGSDIHGIIDICKICQWVRSGQIFNTLEDASLGKLLVEMDGWSSANRYGIKQVIKDLAPDYMEDWSKPAPEAMVEALRYLCKSLAMQQVRISRAV